MNGQFYGKRIQERQDKARQQAGKSLNVNVRRSQSPLSRNQGSPGLRKSQNSGGSPNRSTKHISPTRLGRGDKSHSPIKLGKSPLKNRESINIQLGSHQSNAGSPNKMNQLQIKFNENLKTKLEKQLGMGEPVQRKMNISNDDPFSSIFIKEVQYNKKSSKLMKDQQAKARQQEIQRKKIAFELNYNDAKTNSDQNKEDSEDQCSSAGEKEDPSSWQTEQFFLLPENVQNAINNAKMKKKHSDFYYRLRLLNDKIHVFTNVFYNRVPTYQKNWYEKKRADLEQKLQRQKQEFEEEMKILDKKIQKRTQSDKNVFDNLQFGKSKNNQGALKFNRQMTTLARKEAFKRKSVSSGNVFNTVGRRFGSKEKSKDQNDDGSEESQSVSARSPTGKAYSGQNTPNGTISVSTKKSKNNSEQKRLFMKKRTVTTTAVTLGEESSNILMQNEKLKATINDVEAIVEVDDNEAISSKNSQTPLTSEITSNKQPTVNQSRQEDQHQIEFVKSNTKELTSFSNSQSNSQIIQQNKSSNLPSGQHSIVNFNQKRYSQDNSPVSNNRVKGSQLKKSDNQKDKNNGQNSKILQDAINEINYGVAELIDMRMSITQKTEDAISYMDMNQLTHNSSQQNDQSVPFNTVDNNQVERSPHFKNANIVKKKKTSQFKKKKKIRDSNDIESPYSPSISSMTQKQKDQINQLQNDKARKLKTKQDPKGNKPSFAVKDMNSGEFIQKINENQFFPSNNPKQDFLEQQQQQDMTLIMNERPQRQKMPSQQSDQSRSNIEDLQLKVEQTSEIRANQKHESEITMRNLLGKKETAQVVQKSDINQEIQINVQSPSNQDGASLSDSKSVQEQAPTPIKEKHLSEGVTSRTKNYNQQHIIGDGKYGSGIIDFGGSQLSQQQLSGNRLQNSSRPVNSNMNVLQTKTGQRQEAQNKIQIDNQDPQKILDNISDDREDFSPHSFRDQKQMGEDMTDQIDKFTATQQFDQNDQQFEQDQEMIKQKHKSSLTITGKNNNQKQPEITFSIRTNGYSFAKDNKFIQAKDAPKIRNSYLEEADNAVIAYGTKSSKERTENYSAPYNDWPQQQHTAPTAQPGKRTRKSKTRHIKTNTQQYTNNAYLYQIESQIRSLKSNGRQKSYFKQNKQKSQNKALNQNYQLVHLPNVSNTRAGSSLIKAENYEIMQAKLKNRTNLNLEVNLYDKIERLETLEKQLNDDEIREFKNISGGLMYNTNDSRVPQSTNNKYQVSMFEKYNKKIQKGNSHMSTTEPSSVKSARNSKSRFKMKNQAQTLLDKFNKINQIVNKRTDNSTSLVSNQSGSVMANQNTQSNKAQSTNQSVLNEKKKIINKNKKDICKTPITPSNIENLVIQEKASKSVSQKSNVTAQQGNNEGQETDQECDQLNIVGSKNKLYNSNLRQATQNTTQPLGGLASNDNAENATKKNLFSNENILNVTDEDFSVNKNGTINGEGQQFAIEDQINQKIESSPRMQQTFSGDDITKYNNFESDGITMNKRPVTQLKYDRLNLTSQQSVRKGRENNHNVRINQNKIEEVQKMDQIKEMHVLASINERNKIVYKSRQQANRTVDKISGYKKPSKFEQRRASIQGRTVLQAQSVEKQHKNQYLGISNDKQGSLVPKGDQQGQTQNNSRQKAKMIDFVGPLGTHIRPSKDIKLKFHSPINMKDRKSSSSFSQSSIHKTAITQKKAIKTNYQDYQSLQDALKQQQLNQIHKISFVRDQSRNEHRTNQQSLRESQSNSFKKSQKKIGLAGDFKEKGTFTAITASPVYKKEIQSQNKVSIDLNSMISPNLVEITPRKINKLKNTAIINSKMNNNQLRLPQLQGQNKKFI